MKVYLTNQNIIHSPEKLIVLLQKRIALIWNYHMESIVQKIVFRSMSKPYEMVPDGRMFIIYFSNNVLLNLIRPGEGISDFDQYLKDIENHLIWKF